MSVQVPTNQGDAKEQVARLRALSQQLGLAITAIERNDLGQLQGSIAAQESLCCELTDVKRPSSPLATDSALLTDLRAAQVELAQMNRVYAAVLKRAQRSAALLTALYRSFGEGYAKDAPPPVEKPTLSCEV